MNKTIYKGEISEELLNLYIIRLFSGIPYGIKVNLGGETQHTVTVCEISIKDKEYLKYEHSSKLSLFDVFRLYYGKITDLKTFGKVLCDKDDYQYPLIEYYRNDDTDEWINEIVKPYLRPMSSMTEDEEKVISDVESEFLETLVKKIQHIKDDNERIQLLQKAYAQRAFRTMQFYNRSHLDYNGLIEKGLALEAPEGMYV